ncbi:MAG: NAD-binding protein [Desulfobacterales bacterium]|nr:NAD-binding protein [Desulfobacterales bacterium]
MESFKKRILLVIFTIFMVIMAGTFGYYFLYEGHHTMIDCLYMTVISLTSVGYGEVLQVSGNVPAQIFTIALILLGMGVILYGFTTVAALFIEGELSGFLRKKKMDKQIEKLKNHYIICGGGETGRPLLRELIANREPVVLIEADEKNIERCKEIANLLYINGDATDDRNLVDAGIEIAAGIIISLPSDKDNLYITMTARMLNSKVRIISRMTDSSLKPKLLKAGADSVVSPNSIGALRMVSEMIRPEAVNFLDQMLRHDTGNIRIHQISISEKSSVKGKPIMESGIKNKFDLLVLGAKYNSDKITFNPPPSYVLEPGMTLIVMGEMNNIAKAKAVF